jgi:Zn-dependent alcohol dehydrogenase
LQGLRPLGVAGSIGVPPPNTKLSIDPLNFLLESKRYHGLIEGDSVPAEVCTDPIDVICSRIDFAQFIPRMISMRKEGLFPLDKLVTVYPVENFREALHDMHEGKCIKAVIAWD